MSKDSREERERLKEEYKEHYRKIRDIKERLSRSEKTRNISEALRNMDTSQLNDTFDEFLYKVKSKIANVEARLDVAMDNLAEGESEEDFLDEQERDDELKRARAKETLRQAKIEMGLLYNQIEEQADSIHVEKTIGTGADADDTGETNETKNKESGGRTGASTKGQD